MDIFLVRHGETDLNKFNRRQGKTDIGLNATGAAQAERLGRRLARHSIGRIYASDLRRVRQTAAIVNTHLGVDIIIRKELREINMGTWEGLGWADIQEMDPGLFAAWEEHLADIPYPGGESGADVYERGSRVIREIINGSCQRVAVLTSGGVIKAVISGLLGLGQEKRFRFEADNCGLSHILYDEAKGRFTIKSVNDTSHLGDNGSGG
ncbi:MAG TPA: histidine phosphatase family protein [Selenomonadales bacterium]|nr:histidine phosphatase family protein [Selenomonadales bacterium]